MKSRVGQKKQIMEKYADRPEIPEGPNFGPVAIVKGRLAGRVAWYDDDEGDSLGDIAFVYLDFDGAPSGGYCTVRRTSLRLLDSAETPAWMDGPMTELGMPKALSKAIAADMEAN